MTPHPARCLENARAFRIVEILRSRIEMGLGDGHFPDFGIDGFPDRSQPWMVRAVRKLDAFGDDYFATAA